MTRRQAFLALSVLAGCTPTVDSPAAAMAPFGFDGAAYASAADQLAHGQRLADLLLCTACHRSDMTGAHMGEAIPELQGLYATNISLTMPAMSDVELERVLRAGVHPSRPALYVMPSKSYQHLTDRDMTALIAFLRTVPRKGEATPLPKLTGEIADRMTRGAYHSAAEEVEHYANSQPADLGDTHRLGRYIAMAMCTGCHGARLDGQGEFGGGMAPAARYDDAQLRRFLATGVSRDDRQVRMHGPTRLTQREAEAVLAYVKNLAEQQAQ